MTEQDKPDSLIPTSEELAEWERRGKEARAHPESLLSIGQVRERLTLEADKLIDALVRTVLDMAARAEGFENYRSTGWGPSFGKDYKDAVSALKSHIEQRTLTVREAKAIKRFVEVERVEDVPELERALEKLRLISSPTEEPK